MEVAAGRVRLGVIVLATGRVTVDGQMEHVLARVANLGVGQGFLLPHNSLGFNRNGGLKIRRQRQRDALEDSETGWWFPLASCWLEGWGK